MKRVQARCSCLEGIDSFSINRQMFLMDSDKMDCHKQKSEFSRLLLLPLHLSLQSQDGTNGCMPVSVKVNGPGHDPKSPR